ncbi:MAG TPA: hypothetical protein ENJ54_03775 [Chloroflexi bacterium]|nr:hypothetical protein [Chloroflexota bacterium]
MKKTVLFVLFLGLLAACAPRPAPRPAGTPSPRTPQARPTQPPAPTATAQPQPAATGKAASGQCQAGEASAGDQPSPLYNHQVYLTTTSDGRTFPEEGKLILEHASVPDLVLGPDGHLWVYFVNGEPGHHGIFAARQTDNGTWETVGCVTLDGQFNGNAVDPNVVRLPDGRFRLVYFQGNFVSQTLQPGDPNPIFSAVSDDGLHFTVEGQLIAIQHATDPTLVQLPDGTWLLAVTVGDQTVFARSDDGSHFTEFGEPVRDKGIPELAVFPDGSVGLYLAHMYRSTDGGRTWQRLDDVQVPGSGSDPSLTALPEGGYAFAYKIVTGQAGKPSGAGPGNPQGNQPDFNPFANLTAAQEACLKEAWGEEAFTAITGFQRPPTQEEEPAMEACGLTLPPGGPPPPGGQSAAPEGGVTAQGNPRDITLHLQITQPYLMAFHACDTAQSACDTPSTHHVYLAQSADGVAWQLVPGWQPFSGSVPDLIRRGDTLYIYTPGAVTRYHFDTGVLEATQRVTVEGLPQGFVDPSLMLDDQGRLVLFFVQGVIGGDPGGCNGEAQCERTVRSAVEVSGSDGTRFQPVEGARVTVTVGQGQAFRSLSDPDVFSDGQRMVLLTSHGLSVQAWESPNLHGAYSLISVLSRGQGGVPSGYYDPQSQRYWIYVHYSPNLQTPTVIRLARVPGLKRSLSASDFVTVFSGQSIGLGSTWAVASPSVIFVEQQP